MPRKPMDGFLCPYCFGYINHELVHFRSARVDTDNTGILPDTYDINDEADVERFIQRYHEDDKESIMERLREWQKFSQREDEQYEKFWKEHGDHKTEADPLKEITGIDCYLRPIINPSSAHDREYLKEQPDGGVFIRDADGMVEQIQLKDGIRCTDRVCPYCHNPLPLKYGKYPIKYVSVIGVTQSGKTVYLSQLLKNMYQYAAKVGLTANVRSAASQKFYNEDNIIAEGVQLPAPTPKQFFQQPLFYELSRSVDGNIKNDTIVLYDVAGEVFQNSNLIAQFAPFIEHSDGLIMLIDPKDLQRAGATQSLTTPQLVLSQVQNIVHEGRSDKRCIKPFAICVSKTDSDVVRKVFENEGDLQKLLLDDVYAVTDSDGWPRQVFNANSYAPIAKGLNKFMQETETPFAQYLKTNYQTYAFFGFSALGCDVEGDVPLGPILPKRVEEPLLWLFYEFGFIGKEGTYPLPNSRGIQCPMCKRYTTVALTGEDTVYREHRWLGFGWKEYEVNRMCKNCDYRWYQEKEGSA